MNSMHGHFLSCKIMHYKTFAYCIKHVSSCSSETGMLSLAPDKSFRKTFREKRDNSDRSEFLKESFQPSQNSTNWQPSVSPGEDEKASDQRQVQVRLKTLVWYKFLKPLCGTVSKPLCGIISKTLVWQNLKTLVWYDFKTLVWQNFNFKTLVW